MREFFSQDTATAGAGVPRAAVLATSVLAVVFLAGTIAAPAAAQSGSAAGWVLRLVYAPVCHQIPERTLPFAGGAMAVCARCAGLYLGGIIGLISGAAGSAWARRTPVWLLVAAAAPTVIDALASFFGLWGLANLPRFLLAVPTGAVCGWFLAIGVGDLAGMVRRRKRTVV